MRKTPGSLTSRLLALCVATLLAGQSSAQSKPATTPEYRQSASEPSQDSATEERLAREWGLKSEEWSRYRQLMRGPLGIYSPNLDPLTALGIEARTDEERRHYATLQVLAEGRRTEKLLAYQRAYDDAWRQLYPGLRPIADASDKDAKASGIARSSSVTPGRLAVFVKDPCTPCDERVRELQAAGQRFDIYVVGSQHDDTRVRQWATRVGIDPSKVKSQVITLNHDAGRWLAVGGSGDLPAVLTEIDGQWQRD